jgi:hypothetical protein|tara:strand:- start:615 stop:827 length:213 start_codon:yes stop_codon:yes gene_type:complete
MNKWILQIFLFLALIPLAYFAIKVLFVFAPIFCSIKATNAYHFINYKEMYFWIALGIISFFVALNSLGAI